MSRSAPFKQRLETAIAAAKAAGASRVKITTPDGGSCEIDLQPGEASEINDFDRPPHPVRSRRKGNRHNEAP